MGEEQGLSAEEPTENEVALKAALRVGAEYVRSDELPSMMTRADFICTVIRAYLAARAEGLQPPVKGGEEDLSSLGASRAPSCTSAGVAETPSGGWQEPEPGQMVEIIFRGQWLAHDSAVEMPSHCGRLYRVLSKNLVREYAHSCRSTDCQTSGGGE